MRLSVRVQIARVSSICAELTNIISSVVVTGDAEQDVEEVRFAG